MSGEVSGQENVSGFWAVAATISVLVLGANTPLPLFTIYQAQWGFSTGVLTVIYAAYTVGVVAAVLLLGPLSDTLGRKRVLLPAIAVMAAGLLLGLLAPNVPLLIVSRILQGLAIGAGVTTAVAALGDLHPAAKNHAFVALVTTVATVIGLAGGPLVAGMLAEFGPRPTILPYLVSLVLTALVFIASARASETVHRKIDSGFQLPKIAIPAEIRALLSGLLCGNDGLRGGRYHGGPRLSFTRDLLHDPDDATAGALVALLFLSSAASQIALRGWPLKRSMIVGLVLLFLGALIFAAAFESLSFLPLFVSAAVLGAGHGQAYVGSQELVDRIAPPDRRAQVFSAFQLALYAGATIPAILVGFAAGRDGLAPATLGFVAAILLITLGGLIWIISSRAAALKA